MAKYSYEFKMKMVEEYLNNEGGYLALSDKHSSSDTKNSRIWVAAYKKFVVDGLMRSKMSKPKKSKS
jgi:transposase